MAEKLNDISLLLEKVSEESDCGKRINDLTNVIYKLIDVGISMTTTDLQSDSFISDLKNKLRDMDSINIQFDDDDFIDDLDDYDYDEYSGSESFTDDIDYDDIL